MVWIGVKNPAKLSTLEIDANLNLGSYVITSIRTSYVTSGVGGTILASSDANAVTYSATYTKLKEITVPSGVSGNFTIDFTLTCNPQYNTVYGRIYKNDVAAGTERSTTTTTSPSENLFSFVAGDKIQIYARAESGTLEGANITNFRIKGALTAVTVGVNPTWS